ncbi:MAG: MFS transporter [Bdellovibrionota bacterium]
MTKNTQPPQKRSVYFRRPVLKWALYDWANSAFSTTVMAGFFPIFFKEYWSLGLDASTSTYYLGMANSLAGVALVILSPFLGLFATSPVRKKGGLAVFSLLGIINTIALPFIPAGSAVLAASIFSLASIGFISSFVFYDSLLTDIVPPEDYDQVSSYGYALGYLGGGLLFLINALMTIKPEIFGLSSPAEAVKISFISVGIWWLVFSLPLYFSKKSDFNYEDKIDNDLATPSQFLTELKHTFLEIKAHKILFYFLMAYFFYIEAVNTTIKMAVDYGLSIGLQSSDMIKALLLVQFVAFPFAILFGWIGRRFGSTTGIYICLFVYLGNSIFANQLSNANQFFIMAILIGTVQGGVQALSRSHFASLVPLDKAGPYFGFFNMLGRFSSVLGPALIGLVGVQTNSPRSSIFVLITFFAIGLYFLTAHTRARSIAKVKH